MTGWHFIEIDLLGGETPPWFLIWVAEITDWPARYQAWLAEQPKR